MSDINRRIAEALGWRDLYRSSYWYETYDSGPYEIEAWFGTSPDGDTGALVPDFEHDLNAAYSLFADGPHTVDITVDASGTGVTVDQRSNFAHREHGPQVLAQMLAEVWLAMHKAEQAG